MNGRALTSLVGGRPWEGDEVVPDINPPAPDEHVATVTLAGPRLAGEAVEAAAILRYYAGQTLEPDGETCPSHSEVTFLYARREPLGVVTAITP
jgi:hypothetical protein